MTRVPGRLVYRPAMGRVIVVTYLAFAAWWAVAALTGPGLSWTVVSWMLLAGFALYALFWRPAVLVDPDGVVLVNVVREIRVPWALLEALETRYALTLVTSGRRYASWAASAPGRRRVIGRPGRRGSADTPDADPAVLPRSGWLPGGHTPDRSSRDLRSDSGAAAFMVEQAWQDWRGRPPDRRPAGAPAESPAVPAGSRLSLAEAAGHDEAGQAGERPSVPGMPPVPGTPVPGVAVRWNPTVLAGFAVLVAVVWGATALQL